MFLPIIFSLFSVTYAYPILYEGDTCTLKDGSPGLCADLNKCTSVFEELERGNPPDTLCRYVGFDAVVCCPTATPTPTTTPTTTPFAPEPTRSITVLVNRKLLPEVNRRYQSGEIARQKCAEYSQFGWEFKWPPILLPGQKKVNTSVCAIKSQKLVIGGTEAEPMEFPHMAAIGYNLKNGSVGWRCGGSIISERFILTAAHCTYTDELGDAAWARVGDLNLVRSDDEANPVDIPVADRIRHPEYNPTVQYHDIALLRLETEINFNGWTKPACLHTAPTTGTENGIATGWGIFDWDEGTTSNALLKVVLPLVNSQDCDAKFKNVRTLPDGIHGESMICAGIKGKDTCQGDSGGPLAIFNKKEYCMYDIVGITSFGTGCGHNTPGVYTRVYHYVPWIESTVWGRG